MAYRAFIAVFGKAMFLFQESLEKIAYIDLPGPKGQRFDYLTMDSEDHYLLSAHLGPGILGRIDHLSIDVKRSAPVRASPGEQLA